MILLSSIRWVDIRAIANPHSLAFRPLGAFIYFYYSRQLEAQKRPLKVPEMAICRDTLGMFVVSLWRPRRGSVVTMLYPYRHPFPPSHASALPAAGHLDPFAPAKKSEVREESGKKLGGNKNN